MEIDAAGLESGRCRNRVDAGACDAAARDLRRRSVKQALARSTALGVLGGFGGRSNIVAYHRAPRCSIVRLRSINAPIVAMPIGFTQHMLEHLAGCRARERCNEVDAGRTFEARQSLSYKTDDVVLVELSAGPRHHDR